jgi:hypothetical protein
MSTLHQVIKIGLNAKRPPSHALIMRMVGVYLAAGHKAINLEWNDQSIELTYHDARHAWHGVGSINQESGHKIALELNDIAAFIINHFQIVNIGAQNA